MKEKKRSIKEGIEKKPRLGTLLSKIPNKTTLLCMMFLIIPYIVFSYFSQGKLLITPDFDRSDAFHLNISLKYYLAQVLKQNQLPFWTNQLQGGFPLFAEGQIGALFLPNIIFLRFFDFVTAYNLLFIFSLFSLTIGMYTLLRSISISKLLALLFSFIFTFSGALGFRWVHLNVIQTFSFVPFVFWSISQWKRTNKLRYAIISVFLITQILFAGHQQIAFISLVALTLWYLIILIIDLRDKKRVSHNFIQYIFIIISAIILALPQIIPTFQLAQYSSRSLAGGYQYATQYSLPVNHLISFITPYLYGNPRLATYPEFPSEAGVFWENTPYIGELLSLFIIFIYVFLLLRKKLNIHINVYFFLSILFIVLSLGKNSPLYFIYDIVPFTIFRTPAKFLIPSVFFLIVMAALLTQRFIEVMTSRYIKICTYILIILNVSILVVTMLSYHIFVDSKRVLMVPKTALKLNIKDTYLSLGFDKVWHTYFAQNGWNKAHDIDTYLAFSNLMIPNSNLIYGYKSYDINTGGLRLRRVDYLTDRIEEGYYATKSASLHNLLSIANINMIISPREMNTPLIKIINLPDKKPYYIPNEGRSIQFLDDFIALNNKGLVSTTEAVLEGYHNFTQENSDGISSYKEITDSITLQTSFTHDTLVVFRQNWYPEWHVEIDKKLAPTYRTNLIHIGVNIPKGAHTVSLSYRPSSFFWGVKIALGYIGLIFLLKFLKRFF